MTRIKAVKQKAILDVAESLGYSFRRLSGQIFEHPDHDSFRIFADTNTFKWFSRDIQGDVIDFVQLVAGVTFKEAVSYLETGDFEQAKLIEETYQPFQYYLHEEPFQQARTYLQVVRGLSDQTINTFGRQGLLAQATYHVETVALLSKLDAEHHINIEIDEEDFSSVNIKKDATYPEIKEYVLNKFGFKVSSLYIAQVKRKYDLIERENYNKYRKANGDQHVTNCPTEKEEAIKDALRYFCMI